MSDPVDLIARKTLEFEFGYNGHSYADAWGAAPDSAKERHEKMAKIAVQTLIEWAKHQEPQKLKFRVRHKFTGRTGIVMSEKNGMYTIEWDKGPVSNHHVHPADEFDKISMHPVPAYEMRPNAMVYEVLDCEKDRRE